MSSPQIAVRGCRCCAIPLSLSRYRPIDHRCHQLSPSHCRIATIAVTPTCVYPRHRTGWHAFIPPPPLLSSLSSSMLCHHGTGHVCHLAVVITGVFATLAGTHICPHLEVVVILVVIDIAPAGTHVRPPQSCGHPHCTDWHTRQSPSHRRCHCHYLCTNWHARPSIPHHCCRTGWYRCPPSLLSLLSYIVASIGVAARLEWPL